VKGGVVLLLQNTKNLPNIRTELKPQTTRINHLLVHQCQYVSFISLVLNHSVNVTLLQAV